MFNIVIGIIDIRMFPICNTPSFNKPCSTPGYAIDDRLFDFSEWRGTQNADAGLWHLVAWRWLGASMYVCSVYAYQNDYPLYRCPIARM